MACRVRALKVGAGKLRDVTRLNICRNNKDRVIAMFHQCDEGCKADNNNDPQGRVNTG